MVKSEEIALEKTSQYLSKLGQVGPAITSQPSLKKILNISFESIQKFMSADLFAIGSYESTRKYLNFHIRSNVDATYGIYTQALSLKNSEHLAKKCFDMQTSLSESDFQEQDKALAMLGKDANYQSVMYIPLHHLHKKIGVLTVHSTKADAYSEIDLYVLQNFAVFISIAIENAQVYKKMKSQNEEIMRKSREYQSLIKAMPQSLFRTDIDGNITFANQAFLKQLGIKLENLIGRKIYDFYVKELTDILRSDDLWVFENENDLEAIRVLKTSPLVEAIVVQMIKSPIFDMESRVIGVQTTFWDITEKQKNQDHLRLQKVEIRKQARELTKINRELEKKQADIKLINARLEAEIQRSLLQIRKTKEELDFFLYRASHDLRRPLTTLMGLTQVARLSLDNPDAVRLFEKVDTTAHFMDKMLAKLLMISEIHETNFTVKPIQFENLLNQIYTKYKPELREKGIQWEYKIKGEITFKSITKLIEIILENLVENAINFYQPDADRGSFLKVKVYQKKDILHIIVSDNGQGIASEHHSKVFKMYQRANSSSQGNGLGLYVVKKALNALGGQVSLASKKNEFSEFHIILPPFQVLNNNSISAEINEVKETSINSETNSVEKAKLQMQIEALESEKHILQSLNNTKDQFLKILSQDFKRPLKSLFHFAQQINNQYDKLKPQDIKKLGLELENATKEFSQMIDNLFLMTILQLDNWTLSLDEINIDEVVQNVANQVKPLIKAKNLHISIDIPAYKLFSDKVVIENVLHNLLSNAIRFTPEQGNIEVYSEINEEECLIHIKDSGMGIPEDIQHLLFRIENKISLPDTEGRESNGWGLLLSQDFIKKIGGKVWLESKVSQGSIVSFNIPLRPQKKHSS